MDVCDIDKREGLTVRKLKHGGFLVTHPDIYVLGSLYFAATTIEETFAFVKGVLDGAELQTQSSEDQTNDSRPK